MCCVVVEIDQLFCVDLTFAIFPCFFNLCVSLRYSLWMQYGPRLFGCSDVCARAYFEQFLVVHSKNAKATSKPLLSVDFSEFLVFLFCQKLVPAWSKYQRTSQTSSLRAVSSSSSVRDEAIDATEFILTHLPYILPLLRDPYKQLEDVKSNNHRNVDHIASKEVLLDKHEFNRLGFLLYAATTPGFHQNVDEDELHLLSTFAPFWRNNSHAQITSAQAIEWIMEHVIRTLSANFPHPKVPASLIACKEVVGQTGSLALITPGTLSPDLRIVACSQSSMYRPGISRYVWWYDEGVL